MIYAYGGFYYLLFQVKIIVMIKFFQFAGINVLLILPAIFIGCTSAKINKAQSETVSAGDSSMLTSKLPRHPRLIFPSGQESNILNSAEKNALLADLIKALRSEADKAIKLPLQIYTSDGNMLHVSRDQIARVLTLSMAYRLFRDDKYAARTEAELLNVCGFVNWSPSHFLDDAEMTTAVAIEIGSESYSLPDFWDYKPGGVRWNYFRNTNEAHSTISWSDAHLFIP